MSVYYNENDPHKAAWLAELMKAGVIADGTIDTRSIKEVRPWQLAGFKQCHFFAGIGIWSYALRLAGWADDRSVWTGSCPCPSFSAAGKGEGFDDPRHLWPDWSRLICQRKPPTIFGEQADDAIGFGWLDLVQTDLERAEYAVGKAVLGACSVGAPHIRQRLYFVANAESGRLQQRHAPERNIFQPSANGHMDKSIGERLERHLGNGNEGHESGWFGEGQNGPTSTASDDGDVADTDERGQSMHWTTTRESGQSQRRSESDMADSDGRLAGNGDLQRSGKHGQRSEDGSVGFALEHTAVEQMGISGCARVAGGTNFWDDIEWIPCIDGKARPVEPGTFPLAHGVTNRILKLRGYGDAIVPQVAAEFIKATKDVIDAAH